MSADRRLGRGLEALLGSGRPGAAADVGEAQQDVVLPEQRSEDQLLRVNVYDIDSNPYQPRTEFDEEEINSLAASIKQHGLLQPVVLRRSGDRFQLISGERRWRAAIRAGWSQVPATIREADDRQVAEMTIVENLQRKDLGPLEKAVSFQKYLQQYGCTQEDLAGRLSIDRSTIANLIRLLELPATVQDALRERRITAGHARALLPLGDEGDQVAFCQRIRDEQLSVRATEQLVAETIHAADREPLQVVSGAGKRRQSTNRRRQHLSSLEQQLRTALGTRVEVRQSAGGRGRITIHFTSSEEFDRLWAVLNAQDKPQSRVG